MTDAKPHKPCNATCVDHAGRQISCELHVDHFGLHEGGGLSGPVVWWNSQRDVVTRAELVNEALLLRAPNKPRLSSAIDTTRLGRATLIELALYGNRPAPSDGPDYDNADAEAAVEAYASWYDERVAPKEWLNTKPELRYLVGVNLDGLESEVLVWWIWTRDTGNNIWSAMYRPYSNTVNFVGAEGYASSRLAFITTCRLAVERAGVSTAAPVVLITPSGRLEPLRNARGVWLD